MHYHKRSIDTKSRITLRSDNGNTHKLLTLHENDFCKSNIFEKRLNLSRKKCTSLQIRIVENKNVCLIIDLDFNSGQPF